MSLFEFTFALQAIILGLALTHLVVSLNRLVLARKRVKWALQPLLAAGLVLLLILLFWTDAWSQQGTSTTVGAIILGVVVNLLVFAAAGAVLPESAPEGRTTDIGAHFEEHRAWFFGLWVLPIAALGVVAPLVRIVLGHADRFNNWPNVAIVAAAVVCMAVRVRWLNILLMTLLLVFIATAISTQQLTQPAG